MAETWKRSWVVAAGLVLVLVAAGRLAGSGLIDDAYIFARFAENLSGGHGLRFNPAGEPVEGFTSLAWLALAALGRALGANTPSFLRGAGVAAGALAVWIVVRRPAPPGRWMIAALLATSPILAYWSGTGMDAAAFAAATAGVGASVLRRPLCPWRLGIAVSVAAWVRPEGLFVLAPWAVLAILLIEEPTTRARCIAILVSVVALSVLPQFVARRIAFHEWLPNTFHAKTALTGLERLWHGVKYLWRQLPVLLGWIVLSVAAARCAWARRDRPALALILGAAVWAGYVAAVGGDHFALGRFILPVLVFVALAALRVLALPLPIDRPRALRFALAAALSLSALSYLAPEARRARGEVELARAWLRVGRWLKSEYPPQTRVATIVAGAIPYASGFETFDMLGLVTARVAREGRSFALAKPGHQRYDTAALLEFDPDVIVYPTSGRFREPAWQDPARIDLRYAYALWDAVEDERVQARYEPRIAWLPDGTCVELLVRR